jgi:undecaprenyl phosphate-alpha-L-ara4N flippase subunit ArnE
MNLKALQWLGLVAIPFVVAAGQILFKMTATSNAGQGLTGLLGHVSFWVALIIYGAATIAWIPTIETVPINKAYLFMALTYIYVPILSTLFLNERIAPQSVLGIGVVILGIVISVWR